MPLKDSNGKLVSTPASVPNNRVFRDAWVADNNDVVTVDLTKAKAIANERIARARNAKATELMRREFMGEDVTAEKAVLSADPGVDNAGNVAALETALNAALQQLGAEQ